MPSLTVPAFAAMMLISGFTALAAADIRRIDLDGQPLPSVAVDPDAPEVKPIHEVATPLLELFPAPVRPSHGTVLISPGGGYGVLAISHEGRNVAAMLNAAGWDAAVLFYHISAGRETRALALADAEKALALVQERGQEFGLSTAEVGAMGFSAGGHLTARLAYETEAGWRPPAFIVLMYPAYLEDHGQLVDGVGPTGIPVFLCVGDADKSWYPSSQVFAAACQATGVRCEYLVGAGVGHGFGMRRNLPPGVQDWPAKLVAFLASRKHLDLREHR